MVTQGRKLVLNLAGGLQKNCRKKHIEYQESKRENQGRIPLPVVKVPMGGGGKPGTDIVVRGVTL